MHAPLRRTRPARRATAAEPLAQPLLATALLALATSVVTACGAVPFLRNDPTAPRDRASRFDRFVGELDLALTDTAPVLERVRRATHASDLNALAWEDERRASVRRTVVESALRRLEREFPPNRLDDDRAVVSRILRADLSALSAAERRDDDGEDQQVTLVDLAGTPWQGLLVEAPSVLAREHPRASAEDLEAWATTIDTIVESSGLVIAPADGMLPSELYGAAFWRAYRVPRVVVDQTLDFVVTIQASAGAGGPLDPFAAPLEAAAKSLTGRAAERFEETSRNDLERRLAQTYEDLVARVEESLAASAAEEPRGGRPLTGERRDEWLALLRDGSGRTDATPELLQGLVRREMDRLSREIARALGLEDDSPAAGRAALRSIRSGERDVPGSERPRRAPELLWDDAKATLDTLVRDAPDPSLRAVPAAPYERSHGRWSPFVRGDLTPAGDPRARPSLYLTPSDGDASVPRWLREAEAWRYGVPGRAVLDGFRREATGMPSSLRWTPRETFEEGWGLYAVQAAAEAGAITEIDGGFGRLAQELVSHASLLVDMGVHADGWTRRQAIDYLLDVTPLPESAASDIVLRCLSHPGRCALPTMGLLRLRTLRRTVEDELGDDFVLAEFHRALLTGGPVPMTEMDLRVQMWIADGAGTGE